MINQEPIPVRTLLGARGFDTSWTCLKSLVDYSADPVRLIIHEDGTLTQEHRQQLREIDAPVEFIGRPTADGTVSELLAKYPNCLAFRQTQIMALKLFDIVLLCQGSVAYCDSDILFLRRYTGLFRQSDPSRPTFMTDVGHAYAIRPWRLKPLGSLHLAGRLNAGFTVAPANYLDLDYLEWLLGVLSRDSVFARRRYWTEQTCWAALAARSGAELLDPRAMVMATGSMNGYTSQTVGIHFVATHRDKLKDYVMKQGSISEAPVTLETRSTRNIGPIAMMWTDIRRRFSPLG